MKAMIMAAGVGSRLMPLTMHIPKPMVPLGNRPLMENTIHLLGEHGINSVIANLHYQPEVITEYFGDGINYGVSLNYSPEEELMGTAGGVKRCEWFLNDTFVVISGDALTDINLDSLIKAHYSHGSLATIALKEVEQVEHFGIVITDENHKIKSFQEKPPADEALSKMANTGIYIFEPEIFKYIPARQFYDFGKQVFPHLVKSGAPFYGVKIDDYWCDVGNINTYRQAHQDLLAGKVRAIVGGNILKKDNQAQVLTGYNTIIGEQVKMEGTVVIGDGCVIEDKVTLRNSVIWNDSKISSGAVINGSVVGSECMVGRYVHIGAGSVIASRCVIQDSSVIPDNSKLFNTLGAATEVESG